MVCKQLCTPIYKHLYIFTAGLRESKNNGSGNLSTSVGGTTQNNRTSPMSSDAESEVPLTDQGEL